MRLSSLYQVVVVLFILKINQIHSIGNVYSTTEGHQYYINDEQKYTWFDGLKECLIRNMTLATIETESKSRNINTLVKNSFGKNIILWVGGFMSYYLDSQQYTWISTGQSFSYEYWHVNNPDFNNNREYCVQIGWGANMEWNDNICVNKFGFICQQQHKINDEQSMEKKLQEFKEKLQKEIRDRQNLEQELNIQKRAEQNLKEQLDQIKYYEIKKQVLVKDFQAKLIENDKLRQELQKQQLELSQLLQSGSQNFTQIQQKQLEWKNHTAKELQAEENNKKYRDIIFQFNQNTHVLRKEKLT